MWLKQRENKCENKRVGEDVMIPDPTSSLKSLWVKYVNLCLCSNEQLLQGFSRERDKEIFVFLKGHSLQFGGYIADRQAWM